MEIVARLVDDHLIPQCRKQLLRKLRSHEPWLEKRGLLWSDVEAVVDALDSLEELQSAVDDPMAFLLAGATGEAAKRLLIAQLRPRFLELLKCLRDEERGRLAKADEDAWEVVESRLAETDADQLRKAMRDPLALLRELFGEVQWRDVTESDLEQAAPPGMAEEKQQDETTEGGCAALASRNEGKCKPTRAARFVCSVLTSTATSPPYSEDKRHGTGDVQRSSTHKDKHGSKAALEHRMERVASGVSTHL